MLFAALGSNLACGLTDAVMYLLQTRMERVHKVELVRRVRAANDPVEAGRLIADELPPRLAAAAGPNVLEAIRGHLVKMPELHAGFGRDDFVGAAGVALLVVLSTFPVVIPFMVFADVAVALRVSNGLALATLFVSGWILGQYCYRRPWLSGLVAVAIGAVLVAAIMAFGG